MVTVMKVVKERTRSTGKERACSEEGDAPGGLPEEKVAISEGPFILIEGEKIPLVRTLTASGGVLSRGGSITSLR
jgi:hypothetical protein